MGVNVTQMGGGGKKIAESTATTVVDVSAQKAISAKGITKGSYDEQSKILLPYTKVASAIGIDALPSDVKNGKVFFNKNGRQVGRGEFLEEKSISVQNPNSGNTKNVKYNHYYIDSGGLMYNVKYGTDLTTTYTIQTGKTITLTNAYLITGISFNNWFTPFTRIPQTTIEYCETNNFKFTLKKSQNNIIIGNIFIAENVSDSITFYYI